MYIHNIYSMSTKLYRLFMDKRYRIIGEYHRHLRLYLAGCLTWRKLENWLSSESLGDFTSSHRRPPTAYQYARFTDITPAVPIGQLTHKLVHRCRLRYDSTKTNIFYIKFYSDGKIHNLYDQSRID